MTSDEYNSILMVVYSSVQMKYITQGISNQ